MSTKDCNELVIAMQACRSSVIAQISTGHCRRALSREDAEDVVQMVMTRIWKLCCKGRPFESDRIGGLMLFASCRDVADYLGRRRTDDLTVEASESGLSAEEFREHRAAAPAGAWASVRSADAERKERRAPDYVLRTGDVVRFTWYRPRQESVDDHALLAADLVDYEPFVEPYNECLQALPDQALSLIEARDSGQSYADIASAYGMTVAQVNNRLHRARLALRDCFRSKTGF